MLHHTDLTTDKGAWISTRWRIWRVPHGHVLISGFICVQVGGCFHWRWLMWQRRIWWRQSGISKCMGFREFYYGERWRVIVNSWVWLYIRIVGDMSIFFYKSSPGPFSFRCLHSTDGTSTVYRRFTGAWYINLSASSSARSGGIGGIAVGGSNIYGSYLHSNCININQQRGIMTRWRNNRRRMWRKRVVPPPLSDLSMVGYSDGFRVRIIRSSTELQ